MHVRQSLSTERAAVEGFLAAHNSARVARGGRLEAPMDHPALVAVDGNRVLGVLTYVLDPRSCEVLTLHADVRREGVGTELLEAVQRIAREHGCRRLWLITTNDNVDALRFYQRRGLRLAALHKGAVDDARARLKPEIPELGDHGIPLRDELELELDL
jgi:ribosomal protein S18 acetylase RimI-like enzyme